MRKPAIHGRDHGLWGADPIRIGLSHSPLMGKVLGSGRLADGFGLYGGQLYMPNRESLTPLQTGESIEVAFSHADPEATAISHFEWIAARAHIVSGGLSVTTYAHSQPWQSSPFRSSTGGTGTYASVDIPPFSPGNWNGFFYGMFGVSDDDTDVVHFETPGGEIDRDEDYGWDVAGVGHIGYLFHDFDTSETGNLTISWASGAGTNKAVGVTRCTRTSAVTVGAMAGEEEVASTARVTVDLTDDVASNESLIVVSASQGPNGYFPSDANAYPAIIPNDRNPASSLRPMFRIGSQLFPVVHYIGGLGAAGGDIDGGSP